MVEGHEGGPSGASVLTVVSGAAGGEMPLGCVRRIGTTPILRLPAFGGPWGSFQRLGGPRRLPSCGLKLLCELPSREKLQPHPLHFVCSVEGVCPRMAPNSCHRAGGREARSLTSLCSLVGLCL